VYNERVSVLEKTVEEHEDILSRVIKDVDGKINKKNHNDLAKDVEKLEENFKQLLDQVNNIKIPAPVQASDDSSKYKALERMLITVEEKLDLSKEELNKKMSGVSKVMDMIKEDVDRTLEEQEKQLLKAVSKANICELRIDVLEKQVKNKNLIKAGNVAELDFKEAMKVLKDLEEKMNAIKDGKLEYLFKIYRFDV